MKFFFTTWSKWKKISKTIGDFQLQFIFSVLYYLVVIPVGLLSTIFNDYFSLKKFPGWRSVKDSPKTLAEMKRQ